jgi:putative FmdB family regulatory protein
MLPIGFREVNLPLYEYRCLKCAVHFEKIQKFSDPLLTTCPQCGGKLEQLLSSPAIQFKGSGWYITDYARKSETSSKEDSAASPKSETKPSESKVPEPSSVKK